MSELRDRVDSAIREELLNERLWLYANYHCNLTCVYCLTESSPRAAKRLLPAEVMVAVAEQAEALGFRSLGMTGGEAFMRPDLPETIAALEEILPIVVLTNGTLFTDRLLDRIAPLAGRRVEFQISLDSADPDLNDAFRAPENFAKVIRAIPRLLARGHAVRVATTHDRQDADELARLRALIGTLGVPPERHLVRPIVHRGRAVASELGVVVGQAELAPQVTVTADGVFWNPFAPTVREGRLDTDLLVCRRILPLSRAVEDMLALINGRPSGNDALLDIR